MKANSMDNFHFAFRFVLCLRHLSLYLSPDAGVFIRGAVVFFTDIRFILSFLLNLAIFVVRSFCSFLIVR